MLPDFIMQERREIVSEARKRYDADRERRRREFMHSLHTGRETETQNTPAEEIVYSEIEEPKGRTIGQRVWGFVRSFFIVLFVLGFVGACIYQSYVLDQEAKEIDAQIEQIQEEMDEQKAKVLEYRVDKAYYESDQYKEDMARNRFRLIYPGEILIQVSE